MDFPKTPRTAIEEALTLNNKTRVPFKTKMIIQEPFRRIQKPANDKLPISLILLGIVGAIGYLVLGKK
jgi:hypothetical protein